MVIWSYKDLDKNLFAVYNECLSAFVALVWLDTQKVLIILRYL